MTTLYTIREVAQVLKVSEFSVRRMIRSGKLPHVRVGCAIRVLGEDVERQRAERKEA